MRRAAGAITTLLAALVFAACAGGPAAPVPSSAPLELPPGTGLVDVPVAGVSLPVPVGWRTFSGAQLADPAFRTELAGAFPNGPTLMKALESASGRAELVFLAVETPAPSGGGAPASVALFVSQPSVSGPLLDFVAGFVDAGFRETLGLGMARRSHERTRVGEAVKLDYRGAPGAGPLTVAWLVGARRGTLLIATMDPSRSVPALDPDALVKSLSELD